MAIRRFQAIEGSPGQSKSWLQGAVASVGASFEQVVKLNNYVVDIGTNVTHYREVRDRYVNKAAPPASTTIGVFTTSAPRSVIRG
jgi:enamine deaminase RidA (YjgF/YER057c/UK114 family)